MSSLTGEIPMAPIPYGRQTLDEDDVAAVLSVLRSPFLTQGPWLERFEEAVAQACDVPYAVAFSSGTAALHAACAAAGLGPGDEAITTPLTFVATANAVLYQQARPVFADIDPQTWNLSPEAVQVAITPRTKAVLPVHFAGQPVNLHALYALADRHGLVVIEDACHALGAAFSGQPIGHCRDMAVFSFHPVKSITTGEGGMVVTPHRRYYDALRRFRTHGITRDPEAFCVFEAAPWAYEMQSLGYNYRMTDIQAALGTSQVAKLPDFIQRRRDIAARYREAFHAHPGIRLQQAYPDAASAHHLFPIQLGAAYTGRDRQALFAHLMQANIRPQVHYLPVHLQPYYRQHLGTAPGDCPHAERYGQTCLSLPIFPTLTDREQAYVIDQVQAFFAEAHANKQT